MDYLDLALKYGLGGVAVVMLYQFKQEVRTGFAGVRAILAGHSRELMVLHRIQTEHAQVLDEIIGESRESATTVGFRTTPNPKVGTDVE